MSVLYNYKGMQSVVPETRQALPALPFWVGPSGEQGEKGRINRIVPLVIIDSGHVTLPMKGFSAREVIGWGFLESDLAGGGRSWRWSGSGSR